MNDAPPLFDMAANQFEVLKIVLFPMLPKLDSPTALVAVLVSERVIW